jgi:hypothetical protein
MISENELVELMADLESDRVERTISTNDTTKFRETICAFSNDFPNHRQPGYLLMVGRARIPRFKANPLARPGCGAVYYSVSIAEKFLCSRTFPDPG